MRDRALRGLLAAAVLGAPAASLAYPGGTPNYQTDMTPACAGCHSSRSEDYLEGAGERAAAEVAERKHLLLIDSGQKGYAELSAANRQLLAEQIRALDAASTVTLVAPGRVKRGETFEVTVRVTGGAGPVVGVALVDRAHRWYARPAPSAGWQIAAPPVVNTPNQPNQQDWLSKRPKSHGRNLSYVNVVDIQSDSAKGQWARADVVFTLRAPQTKGRYPLVAAFLYGTEKATPLGYQTDALGRKKPRGGTTGGSGRVLFTEAKKIRVD